MTWAAKIRMFIAVFYCATFLTPYVYADLTQTPEISFNKDFDQKVNRKLEFLLDETNSLSINQILKTGSGWSIPESDNLTFGLQTTTAWIKLRFLNTEKTKQTLFLEFNPVFLEKIEAFDETGTPLDIAGSTTSFDRIESFPTVKFDIPAGKSVRYVSVKSRSNSLAVRARAEDNQKEKIYFDLIVFSILAGGLLLLFTYHLFLFATYRNWMYLFYSLFIAATLLFTVSFCAFHKVLLPATLFGFHVDFWWSALSAPILLFTMFLFSAKLLDVFPSRPFFVKKNWKKLALLLLPITEVLCMAGVFITDNAAMLIPIRFSGLIHVIVLPAVAIVLWNRKRTNIINLFYAFSWVPFAVGGFLIVAWLSGAVEHNVLYSWSLPIGAWFQSLLLSFAVGQQLNVVTKELEIEVNKLSRRDQVITTFVSSDIVQELDVGEDPLQYQPRNVNKCIGFIDMHNYTTFFETYSAFDCQKILNEYFIQINETTYTYGGKVDKIVGDAMMLEFSDPKQALKTIVEIRKKISEINRKKYETNQTPLKFGLGMGYGSMLSANFGSLRKYDRTLVGDPVNVASRLETITRQFSVDILCSKEFIDLQSNYKFYRPAGYVMLKGRTKKSLVYEVFEHHPQSVVEWKISTVPKLLEAIELELAGKYIEALAVIQSLIDICPPHTRKPGVIMDLTLVAMVGAITEKMRQLELPVPTSKNIQSKIELKKAS
jgi:class 3 adenylate cyclase